MRPELRRLVELLADIAVGQAEAYGELQRGDELANEKPEDGEREFQQKKTTQPG